MRVFMTTRPHTQVPTSREERERELPIVCQPHDLSMLCAVFHESFRESARRSVAGSCSGGGVCRVRVEGEEIEKISERRLGHGKFATAAK